MLFLHTPKTGGTTLENAIIHRFRALGPPSDGWCPPAVQCLEPGMFAVDGGPDAARRAVAALAPGTRVFSGHFWFGVHRYLDRPWFYVTILRDPVVRVVSLHSHFRRFGDDVYEVAARGLDIESFVNDCRCPEVDNDQTRRLSGECPPFGECTPEMLELAKRNLDEHFPVFGLTHRFDEFTALLELRLGWRGLRCEPQLVNDRRPHPAALPNAALEAILDHNRLDLELYAHAERRFGELLAAEGESFTGALAAVTDRR